MNDTIIINKLNTNDLYNYNDDISTIHNDDIYYISKEIEFNYLLYKQSFINNKSKNKKLYNDVQYIRRRELYKIKTSKII